MTWPENGNVWRSQFNKKDHNIHYKTQLPHHETNNTWLKIYILKARKVIHLKKVLLTSLLTSDSNDIAANHQETRDK